jgi:hypothetical protein
MNPLMQIFENALKAKAFMFIVGISAGVVIEESLPFLAAMTPKEPTMNQVALTSARKDRDALMPKVDSIIKMVEKHPSKETVYRTINENVDRVTRNTTNAELDSILANWKYTPFTKEGDRERLNRFR